MENNEQEWTDAVASARAFEMGEPVASPVYADKAPEPQHGVRLGVEHLDLFYGDHHALKDVNIAIRDRDIHVVYRSVRLRQVHAAALLQPNER